MRTVVITTDSMQVCANGHPITQYAATVPASRSKFCKDCGARTIDACEYCGNPIKVRHNSRYQASHPIPKYCGDCGAAYPWQASAIENLKEIWHESELSPEDVQELDAALPDLLHDTPKTESASLRMKRILAKMGKPLYEVAIKVVTDIASDAAKKSLGL